MNWQPDQRVLGGDDLGTTLDNSTRMVPFLRGLCELAPSDLLASWADEPRLSDPRQGLVAGRDEFRVWLARSVQWLTLSDATVEPVHMLNTAEQSVEEVVLHLSVAGDQHELPVATVATWNRDHLLTSIRIHHLGWPRVACAVPWPSYDSNIELPAVIRDQIYALASRDPDRAAAGYADAATLRDASIDKRIRRGREQIREFYAETLGQTLPARQIRTVTHDRSVWAVEVGIGRRQRQLTGLLVYECDTGGRILSHRAYGYAVSSADSPGASAPSPATA